MITGIHNVLFTRYPVEVRSFFHDILAFASVDAGHDWLIFSYLPPKSACIRPGTRGPCDVPDV